MYNFHKTSMSNHIHYLKCDVYDFFMFKKVLCCVLIILLGILSVKQTNIKAADFNEGLYSKACILLDGDSGRVLYEKESKTPLANASTTKILTCIIALECGDLDSVVTISQKAAMQPKVRLGVKENEQFYFRDLLYALMLESYNDTAVAIAEHIAGSTIDFSTMMNQKAKEIGCLDTYFITPNGLDASDDIGHHHTTAEDLAKIMKYCCWESDKSELFLEITECRTYDFCDLNGKSFRCLNRNSFLDMYDGVISGKTGFTAKAGYCYVAAYEKNNKKFCIVLLACGWPNHKNYKWSDANKLLDFGINNYDFKKIKIKNQIKPILVKNGYRLNSIKEWNDDIYIKPDYKKEDLKLEYLVCDSDRIAIEVHQENKWIAPIKKGTVVGEICVVINGNIIHKIPLYISDNIYDWSFLQLLKCIFTYFLL